MGSGDAFGLDSPGTCLDTQHWLPMRDRKVLAEDRETLMAGRPLPKPESMSFPGRVLPHNTLSCMGHQGLSPTWLCLSCTRDLLMGWEMTRGISMDTLT